MKKLIVAFIIVVLASIAFAAPPYYVEKNTGIIHTPGIIFGSNQEVVDVVETAISPIQFGAKFDGVTDDTAAFDAAFATGKPVRFHGTAKGTLNLPNSFNIITDDFKLIGNVIAYDLNDGRQTGWMNIVNDSGCGLQLRKTTSTSWDSVTVGDLSTSATTTGDGVCLLGNIGEGVYYNTFNYTKVWAKAGIAYHLEADAANTFQKVASNVFLHPLAFLCGGGIHMIGASHNTFIEPNIEQGSGTTIKIARTTGGADAAGNRIFNMYAENPLAVAYDLDPAVSNWDISTAYNYEETPNHIQLPRRSQFDTVLIKTTSFALNQIDTGNTIYSNGGATSVITATLPPWKLGMTAAFLRSNASYSFTIAANGTDKIRLSGVYSVAGGNLSMRTSGTVVVLKAIAGGTNAWDVASSTPSAVLALDGVTAAENDPVVRHTANFVLVPGDSEYHSNAGAAAIITATLHPALMDTLTKYTFIRNNATYAFTIVPDGTDVIRIGGTSVGPGGSLTIYQQGGTVSLICSYDGIWDVISSVGVTTVLSTAIASPTGDTLLRYDSPQLQLLTAAGANRNVRMPVEIFDIGIPYLVSNMGTTTSILIKSSGGATTHATIAPEETALCFSLGVNQQNKCHLLPAAGVNDYLESIVTLASAVTLTNTITTNITSITMTPGEWDVTGTAGFKLTSATTGSFQGGVSSTSGVIGNSNTQFNLPLIATTMTENLSSPVPTIRFVVTADTPIYLIGRAQFTAGTVGGYGMIRARRVK